MAVQISDFQPSIQHNARQLRKPAQHPRLIRGPLCYPWAAVLNHGWLRLPTDEDKTHGVARGEGHFRFQISSFKLQTFRFHISHFRFQLSDFKFHISNFHISHFRFQIADFRFSYFGFHISYFRFQISDIRLQISDFGF